MSAILGIVSSIAAPLVIFLIARYWQKKSADAVHDQTVKDSEKDEADDTKKTEQTMATINQSIQKQTDAISKWGGEP